MANEDIDGVLSGVTSVSDLEEKLEQRQEEAHIKRTSLYVLTWIPKGEIVTLPKLLGHSQIVPLYFLNESEFC